LLRRATCNSRRSRAHPFERALERTSFDFLRYKGERVPALAALCAGAKNATMMIYHRVAGTLGIRLAIQLKFKSTWRVVTVASIHGRLGKNDLVILLEVLLYVYLHYVTMYTRVSSTLRVASFHRVHCKRSSHFGRGTRSRKHVLDLFVA